MRLGPERAGCYKFATFRGVKAVDLLHVAVVALIQGITEFLPVSASGHLAVLPLVSGWPPQAPAVDVAVRVGTLGAVVAYFWRDLWTMAIGLFRYVTGRRGTGGAHLAFKVAIGTVPAVVAWVLVDRYLPGGLHGLRTVGWAMLGFGIVLFMADRMGMTIRRVEHLAYGDAVVIGIAQTLALIPGTSRSGIAISAGRILGFERADAARFSMLLAIPALLGISVVKGVDLAVRHESLLSGAAALALVLGFAAGLAAIAGLMAWLRRSSFTPFVIYRVLLGGALLGLGYGWGVQ